MQLSDDDFKQQMQAIQEHADGIERLAETIRQYGPAISANMARTLEEACYRAIQDAKK